MVPHFYAPVACTGLWYLYVNVGCFANFSVRVGLHVARGCKRICLSLDASGVNLHVHVLTPIKLTVAVNEIINMWSTHYFRLCFIMKNCFAYTISFVLFSAFVCDCFLVFKYNNHSVFFRTGVLCLHVVLSV